MWSGWSFVEGLSAGLVVGVAATRLLWPAAAPARELKLYEGKGSSCLVCGRSLLPGMKSCPFCHPTNADALGATIEGEYKPLEELVPMPGLSRAAKQVRDVGARGYLHVFTGPNKGESILLGAGVISIGRAAQNTLILNDENVSQRHAEVGPRKDGYVVKDLGSRNGTFVNDQRIASNEKRLAAGDIVAVGETKMLFQG